MITKDHSESSSGEEEKSWIAPFPVSDSFESEFLKYLGRIQPNQSLA
jgi:hypothetical protein